MSRPLLSTTLILSVMLSVTAHAILDLTGWQRMAGDDIAHDYMSPKYITKVGHKKVQAWVLTVYSQNHVNIQMQAGEYDKVLVIYDCAARTAGLKQWVRYTQTGVVKTSGSIPDHQVQMERVVPQSIGENMLSYACAWFDW